MAGSVNRPAITLEGHFGGLLFWSNSHAGSIWYFLLGSIVRMGRNSWIYNCIVALLLAWASPSHAEIVYQAIEGSVVKTGSTAGAACRAVAAITHPTWTLVGADSGGQCYGYINGQNYSRFGQWAKLSDDAGNACVGTGQATTGFGFIINSAGDCVDYVHADTPSQCKNLGGTSGSKYIYVSFDGDGNPQTPPPITAGGCEAIAYDVSHCVMAPKRMFPTGGSIQPVSNKCRVGVRFTGNTLAGGSTGPAPSPNPPDDGLCSGDCPPVDPAPIANDSQPCTYVLDGEGRKVCSSSNFNYSPGNSSCGTVNGTFQCVGKSPTTNGIVIDTTVTDTTNADGSTTSVKKDTASQIVCNSPKPCVVTTTTNTTTTNYNSNGAKTGQSTSCTGPACSTDGKGDSDGDGLADCAVGKCEETEGTEVGPQDWHEKGEETYGTAFEAFADRVTASPVMKAGDQFFAFNPSGACPVWSVNIWVFSITLDQHCSADIPWDFIKAIIMSCAGFVAFRWALL